MLTTKHLLVSTTFFHEYKYVLFQSVFWSIIVKKCQLNQEQSSLRCSLPCFLVLLCSCYELLQCFSTYFRKSKEIGVLQSRFPDCIISCIFGEMFLSVRLYFFASDKFPGIFVHFRFLMFIQALMRKLAQI